MKEQNKTTHCKSSNYSMENMEKPEISEEEIGVWDRTKEGVAKAWSATKDGAVKAWDKTKEVTEDITGFGHDDNETAYFEDEDLSDKYGHHYHHSQGVAEDKDHFASFSETDGEMPSHHLHKNSSAEHHSQTRR
jgi:hypothetical protein